MKFFLFPIALKNTANFKQKPVFSNKTSFFKRGLKLIGGPNTTKHKNDPITKQKSAPVSLLITATNLYYTDLV